MPTICETPIVAIICSDEEKKLHVFRFENPVMYQDIVITDKTIVADNLSILISLYESVIICNEYYYDEMCEKLQIA